MTVEDAAKVAKKRPLGPLPGVPGRKSPPPAPEAPAHELVACDPECDESTRCAETMQGADTTRFGGCTKDTEAAEKPCTEDMSAAENGGDVATKPTPGARMGFVLPGVSDRQGGGGYPEKPRGAEGQENFKPPTAGIMLPLPVQNRGGSENEDPSQKKPAVAYVTDTINTPGARRPDVCKNWKPVPITKCRSISRDTAEGVPRISSSGLLNQSNDFMSFCGSESPKSLSSSLSGNYVPEGGFPAAPQRKNSRVDSMASFRWAPGNLLQSWHKKMSDTYSDLNIRDLIGEGRSGAVFVVQNKFTDVELACKVLNKVDHNPEDLRQEIELLRRLDHPNIVRLYETNEDQDSLFVLMELCLGGDLFDRIVAKGFLPEEDSCIFVQQLLSALAYCHSTGVVHRDVKPENLLLESADPDCMVVKLADFGIAARIPRRISLGNSVIGQPNNAAGQVTGSVPYMAPEMFKSTWKELTKEAGGSRNKLGAVDMWSVGIVLYVMLSGDFPYGDNVEMICSSTPPDFTPQIWNNISADAKYLILMLVNPAASERWTARQSLAHDWFRDCSPEDIETSTAWCYDADGELSTCPTERRSDLARSFLARLRQWKRMNKLKRLAIAAVAQRLEAEHSSLRFAQIVYRSFSDGQDPLTCERLQENLFGAAGGDGTRSDTLSTHTPLSKTSSNPSLTGPTISGFHVRQRFKGMVRRFSKISEDTPTGGSPLPGMTIGGDPFGTNSVAEQRRLVDSLSSQKNGIVDWTLLAAACLPESVYTDEKRTEEVFDLFDIKKQGFIDSECLKRALQSKDAKVSNLDSLIAEFDLDEDGKLNFNEFRLMLRGREPPPRPLEEAPVVLSGGCFNACSTGSSRSGRLSPCSQPAASPRSWNSKRSG
eukprot:TRINITY_DN3635_c0_g1_i1.p1 TRINITY_DN3635_c0_g1~~TRINITY_DN3635_c0_g1_i1.p1  ORF type:complete len:881 (-),score=183.24 TRINITY_DN3635_c0_g1_i1:60-2702(-)